jgi:hypothetical protein
MEVMSEDMMDGASSFVFVEFWLAVTLAMQISESESSILDGAMEDASDAAGDDLFRSYFFLVPVVLTVTVETVTYESSEPYFSSCFLVLRDEAIVDTVGADLLASNL